MTSPGADEPAHPPGKGGLDGLLHHAFTQRAGDPIPILARLRTTTGARLQGVPPEVPDPGHSLPEGARATAHYHVFEEIARGGMGRILRGRDLNLGREVALKVLAARSRDHPLQVERFVEEAQIAGRLQHPGIVPVYELGLDEDDQPFFAMKLVQGRTLGALLAEGAPLPLRLAAFEKVCQAVAYAHSRGVIHRDLKPANVMIGAFGEVLVMDWGLAKALGGRSGETRQSEPGAEDTVPARREGPDSIQGAILGTPAYMPPEQARGEVERLNERSDVFSLGAILCEILTGKPPYAAEDPIQLRERAAACRLEEAFARLDAGAADGALVRLAKECLQPDPEERPRDAGEVAARVTAHLAEAEERSRRAELAAAEARVRAEEAALRAVQERRARRLTLALAASVLLALGAGGMALLWIRGERQARARQTARAVAGALAEAHGLRTQAAGAGGEAGLVKLAAALAAARRALDSARAEETIPELAAQAGALASSIEEEERLARSAAEQAEADRRMAAQLEEIRLRYFDHLAERMTGRYGWDRDAAAYAAAFRERGIDPDRLPPEETVRRIKASALAMELMLSLRDWTQTRRNLGEDTGRLRQVLDLACPPEWRGILSTESNLEELRQAARTLDLEGLPPRILAEFAARMGEAGDQELALGLFRRAQELHPQDHSVQAHCGLFLWKRIRPPRLAEAAAAYRAALALRPESPTSWHQLAWVLFAQGEKERPLAYLHRMVEIRPDLAWAWYELGGGYYEAGDVEKALRHYREAVRLDPGFADAHIQLGVTLLESGRAEEAETSLRKAVELKPGFALAWTNLGVARERRGDLPGAAEAHRQAIAADPGFVGGHYNLGLTLLRLEDAPGAVAVLQEAARLAPGAADCQDALAQALQAVGRLDEAISILRKVLEIDPSQISVRGTLGFCLQEKGDLEGAIACYREVLERKPDLPAALWHLGLALQEGGRYREALPFFLRLSGLGEKTRERFGEAGSRAEECRRMGELEEHLPEYLDGSRQPASPEQQLLLGRLCRARDLHLAAVQAYRAAFEGGIQQPPLEARADRVNAAFSAVRVGLGEGRDGMDLEVKARAGHRAWALVTLRSELAAWRLAEDREAARSYVDQWRSTSMLRGVRGESALATFEPEERERWQTFWAEVDTFLEKHQ